MRIKSFFSLSHANFKRVFAAALAFVIFLLPAKAALPAAAAELRLVNRPVHKTGLVLNDFLPENVSFTKYEIEYNKFATNKVEYICIHDTGNHEEGADAMAHYEYFSGGDRGASAHYFVDDSQIVQIIDDSEGSWHAGIRYASPDAPISNTNSIGIEMCINDDGDYEMAMENTIGLAAYLLAIYGLDEDRLVRHYDANGKICPLTMSENNWALWKEFKERTAERLGEIKSTGITVKNNQGTVLYNNDIIGESKMQPEQMADFLTEHNSEIDYEYAMRIAKDYIEIGDRYGIRGDIAFFQAILETGYMRYGGDADDEYMNFCGLFNKDSSDYARFKTPEEGIEAHIQHLYAYACTYRIPETAKVDDPRFGLVTRGVYTTWESLSGHWAVPGYDENEYSSLDEARANHDSYGDIIIKLYVMAGGTDVQTSGDEDDDGEFASSLTMQSLSAAGRETLYLDMRNDDVSSLQKMLCEIGYEIPITGYFGSMTEAAIMDIQSACGIDIDGIVGEKTWAAVIAKYKTAAYGAPEYEITQEEKKENEALSTTPAEKPDTLAFNIDIENCPTIMYGYVGYNVVALQKILNFWGDYNLDEDGIFGFDTYKVLVKFQEMHGLDVDGIAGPQTWKSLSFYTVYDENAEDIAASEPDFERDGITRKKQTQEKAERKKTSAPEFSFDTDLYLYFGSTGKTVKELQRFLNTQGFILDTDGVVGDMTMDAVKKFQEDNGLLADGIVGPDTWKVIAGY